MKHRSKPRSRFADSVPWLLGPQLISGLRRIISYHFLRTRLDQRNWMTGSTHSFIAMEGDKPKSDQVLWWDYVSDCGDGELAMMNVAFLLYADLYETDVIDDGKRMIDFTGTPEAKLPRGEFLAVGGDTAYHVADRGTLAVQFQRPFHRAWSSATRIDTVPRPMFAIPGNHDYYDELDGFQQQFRRPITDDKDAALHIPGFTREQSASYFVVKLPHDWNVWGVDIEIGTLDDRQKKFFKTEGDAKRLVVLTPEPTTVDGLWVDPKSYYATTFHKLALPQTFLEEPEPMPAGHCRLDLSGDTHNYQRYFGPDDADPKDAVAKPSNYASVVSGGGGAFLHPTNVDFKKVKRKREFPSSETSREEIMRGCLRASKVASGGFVALIGGLAAAMVYIAATHVASSRAVFGRILASVFGLDECRDTVLLDRGTCRPFGPVTDFVKSGVMVASVVVAVVLIFIAGKYAHGYWSTKKKPTESVKRYRSGAFLVIIALAIHWGTVAVVGGSSAAAVILDAIAIAIVSIFVVGLTLFAAFVAGARHTTRAKIGFGVIGLLHGLFHVFLPLTLMRMFSWQAFLAMVVVGLVTWLVANLIVAKTRTRGLLLAWWLVAMAAELIVPRLISGPTVFEPTSWQAVSCVAVAIAVGYLATATTLGWYFAVCLDHDGHGNEAGSVARVSEYKQFIRFKIDPSGDLTAYVIGLENLEPLVENLRPHLIDKFTIRP